MREIRADNDNGPRRRPPGRRQEDADEAIDLDAVRAIGEGATELFFQEVADAIGAGLLWWDDVRIDAE